MVSAKKIAVLSTIAWIVTSAALIHSLVTNRSSSADNPKVSQKALVCTDDVVSDYNKFSLASQRNGSQDYTIDSQSLDRQVKDIMTKAGYAEDPTCLTIIMLSAIRNGDYMTANSNYDALTKLHRKNQFANSNLATSGPLASYKAQIEELSPSKSTDNKAQGGE